MKSGGETTMDRRKFGAMLAMAGVGAKASALASSSVEVLPLYRNGWMPNNDRLPVLFYRGAFPAKSSGDQTASAIETAFVQNGWPPQWRNGVFDFHHYHSTAHEVLGFAAGTARLMLGGEGGHDITVRAGDVALLPAGTGHCRIEASADFLVVGAYPPGEQWDICRTAPDAATLERMAKVAYPASDPVSGNKGPLLQHWKQS
jgi:uncharacterized protein YjlB